MREKIKREKDKKKMFCLIKKFLPNNQKEITTNIHKGNLKKLIIKYLEIKMNLLNKS